MLTANIPNATVSSGVTLYEKTTRLFDYGRVNFGFIKAWEKQDQQEIIKRYLEGASASEYFISVLSTRQYDNSLMWAVLDSSVLTDNPKEIIDEALTSAEIYSFFASSQRQEIELTIANRLKNEEKVLAIYTQRYRSEMQVIVFLDTDKYDNELIHKMLDLEYELQKQFTEPLLAFSYIPNVYENRREVVSKVANLIYEK